MEAETKELDHLKAVDKPNIKRAVNITRLDMNHRKELLRDTTVMGLDRNNMKMMIRGTHQQGETRYDGDIHEIKEATGTPPTHLYAFHAMTREKIGPGFSDSDEEPTSEHEADEVNMQDRCTSEDLRFAETVEKPVSNTEVGLRHFFSVGERDLLHHNGKQGEGTNHGTNLPTYVSSRTTP